MRKIILFLLLMMCISIIIPGIYFLKYGKYKNFSNKDNEEINLYIKEEDKVVKTTISQYLKEVVAAEMPVSFETEALKAQAVAARSYLIARKNSYKENSYPPEHKGADICSDYTHCKAWISEEKRKELWNSNQDANWKKISKAVDETQGEVITFGDEVISAVFHSTSSGKTENSEDVWVSAKPYLVSVESPGEENSPNFKSEKTLSIEEFKKIVQENIEGVIFENELFSDIKRSKAGGIISITLGNVPIKGTVFRQIFGLKSTNVLLEQDLNNVYFHVTGYGHGVGMSQYGANKMAQDGKNYKDILTHYYQGTNIKCIS